VKHGAFNTISKANDVVLQWIQLTSTTQEAHMLKSRKKRMLITFFDMKCTVYFESIPRGQTFSQAYHVEMLKRLRDAIRRKRLELWPTIGFSIMTMFQHTKRSMWNSFWPKSRLLKLNTHPVPLICLRMASGYFRN